VKPVGGVKPGRPALAAIVYGPVEYPFAPADIPAPLPAIWLPAIWLPAAGLLGGILKLGPVVLAGPYGEAVRPALAAVLDSGEGVFLKAGPTGEAEELGGIDRLGLVPAKVDSEGFLDHGNIFEPGIFQPDLHPVCVPAIATTTTANRVQFAILVRMLTIPFDSL